MFELGGGFNVYMYISTGSINVNVIQNEYSRVHWCQHARPLADLFVRELGAERADLIGVLTYPGAAGNDVRAEVVRGLAAFASVRLSG